jgi:hypothetical protein
MYRNFDESHLGQGSVIIKFNDVPSNILLLYLPRNGDFTFNISQDSNKIFGIQQYGI